MVTMYGIAISRFVRCNYLIYIKILKKAGKKLPMAKVVVAEELAAYPTAWYLLCTKRSVKPFVYQLRKATEFSCLVNLTDPNVFDNDEFKFGCYVRDNAGYSLPFLAYKALA